MALVLADGLAITATAEPAGDIVPSDAVLCGLTEGAVRGVFDVLVGDRAKQWTPEPDSFATVPACDVLSGDQVAQQLGITSEQVTRYPAGHQCRWGRAGGDTATAKLDFPVAESLDELGVPAGTPAETIAGRESWVVEAGSADIAVCTAYTKHIAFSLGVGTYEHAALRVAIPVNAGKDVCAVARTLAGAGWPNLPAAGR